MTVRTLGATVKDLRHIGVAVHFQPFQWCFAWPAWDKAWRVVSCDLGPLGVRVSL